MLKVDKLLKDEASEEKGERARMVSFLFCFVEFFHFLNLIYFNHFS